MPDWPEWWEWELDLSDHLLDRMLDRGFNEAELRLMFDGATGYRVDVVEGRWIIETRHGSRSWEIIVEPAIGASLLTVVTAYPIS